MSNPSPRFWLSTPTRFHSDPSLIRVDWSVQGVTRSALGYVDDTRVVWNLGAEVPSSIEDDALEAAYSQADYGAAHVPPGWTFEGFASAREMEDAVECTCQGCGKRVESIDGLDNEGRCVKCWAASMATQRYRICRERRTYAGIATDDTGLIVSATSASAAVENAKRLGLLSGLGTIVAIAEAS
jgi:hypothetical protein